MKRPAELDDKDRRYTLVVEGNNGPSASCTESASTTTVVDFGRFELPVHPTPPPAFPWRRFLSRLAWWAVAVMAAAFVAAEVWP